MKVMILAAGKGERLRPLTDTTPKPLVPLHDKPIVVHLIEKLEKHGFSDIVMNVSHLKDQIMTALGNGKQFGVNIQYSEETTPLETGGGIKKALPLLGDAPFLLVNGDILTDYPFETLKSIHLKESLAHLVLVPEASHTPGGDFGIIEKDTLSLSVTPKYTYSGIAVIHPNLLQGFNKTRFKLYDVFVKALDSNQLTGVLYEGDWRDLGTRQRIEEAATYLKESATGETHDLG